MNSLINKTLKIYIAGHSGTLGSEVWRVLSAKNYCNLIGETSQGLNLTDQAAVNAFYNLVNHMMTLVLKLFKNEN